MVAVRANHSARDERNLVSSLCAPSHIAHLYSIVDRRAPISVASPSSSLHQAAFSCRPYAEPKSKPLSFASTIGSGCARLFAPPDDRALRARARSGVRSPSAFGWNLLTQAIKSPPHYRTPIKSCVYSQNRDSSHEQVVRPIKFFRAYRIVPQCVALSCDDSSSGRKRVTKEFRRCLQQRGPDNGKPDESPRRKATRLQRNQERHAGRAAERSPRRCT